MTMPPAEPRWRELTDPADGTRWRVDVGFLESNWTCIWGRGCEGILDHPAAELQQGCCSVGAEVLDEDEARLISALGASLDPARFEHHAEAADGGVLAGGERPSTRIVDGACIFLNRPGFAGGTGCALHLAAIDDGEPPADWKPSVCWQLPLKVEQHDDGSKTLRRWARTDWGADAALAWCCTEPEGGRPGGASAYVGPGPVWRSLDAELEALVGPDLLAMLRERATERQAVADTSDRRTR